MMDTIAMKPQASILWLGLAASVFQSAGVSENWPQFRGPTGQGISAETQVPLHWSATSNIAWKASIPGEGWSSPIVWEERVFVTTALDGGEALHLICLNRDSGDLLWNKHVLKQSTSGRKEGRNTYATPTPATDGDRVYVAGFDGTFAAVDFSGTVVWTNRDYPFYGQHGLGSSPVLWGDLLIMARDPSSEGDNKKLGWQEPWDKSFLVALDKRTGRQRWKTGRGLSRIAHVVPIIHTHSGKPLLLSNAGDVVQGFDPASGERIWSSLSKGEGVVPSPAAGGDLVFTACGFSGRDSLKAFRLGQRGELGTNNLVWEIRKAMPRVPSLLLVPPHLFTISDSGQILCVNASSGEIVWQEKIEGNYSASPVHAAGRVYFLSDTGLTTVIEAGPEFKVLARNPLEGKYQATIAVSQGSIFIRSEKNLFRIRSGV